jgi:hypothetical protein
MLDGAQDDAESRATRRVFPWQLLVWVRGHLIRPSREQTHRSGYVIVRVCEDRDADYLARGSRVCVGHLSRT